MAKNLIDVGINLNDGTGDNLRTAGTKINAMFSEVYNVFGDGTNLSNLVSNLHIVNDIAPQLGGNLDMNGYIINGNGSINITSSITTSNNLVAVGAVQASTAAISGNSTFGGTVTVGGAVYVGNHATIKTTITDTSLTTGTLNATTELQVVGPASITGAITSGAVGSKMRFYWNNVAAFPSATTYEGGIAFAEDTNRMYFASDTNWLSLAPELDPAFTGTPTAPTAIKATNTTQIATTAHVKDVVADYAPLASPALTGNPTAPTAATADNDTSIATTAHVWANRDALQANIDLKAPLASPSLTGTPLTPTQGTGTRAATGASTQIANSTYVRNVAAEIYNAVDLKAPLASPALTGTPTAPTAAAEINNTQIASTQYVTTGIGAAVTTVNTALALKAPLASPVLTGTPTAPTAAALTNTTQLATTAFVGTEIDTKLGDVTFLNSKLSAYAKLSSPAFTGTPTVPTAPVNDNTTKIANTAWVQREFGYANVPMWGGAHKYVNTSPPISANGVNGDIWIQPGLDDLTTVLYSVPWNSVTDKPSFFDGAYSSLSSKPSLFDGNYNNLSNKPVSLDVATTPVFDGVVDWGAAELRTFTFRIKFENGIDARELVSPEQFVIKITLNDYYTVLTNSNTASVWYITNKVVSVFKDVYANFSFTLNGLGYPEPNKINLTIFKIGSSAVSALALISNLLPPAAPATGGDGLTSGTSSNGIF